MTYRAVVERAGPLCTVQDLGRPRGRRAGVAPGGAMDRRACMWANHMLGNDVRAPLLEVTLGGARIRFEGPALVALTGAECGAQVDGLDFPAWRSRRIEAGQTIDFGYSTSGMRAYLAFAGGLIAPRIFDSASVVVREGLGGPLGEPLGKGAVLTWDDDGAGRMLRHVPTRHATTHFRRERDDAVDDAADDAGCLHLPLHVGYEVADFSKRDQEALFTSEWVVDPSSDRIATRLKGPALTSGPRVLDSVPLVDGTVQIPGDGKPLIFMRDRPTIGGYPKVGSVDPVALDHLAQARPGTRVRFVPGDLAAGLNALRRLADFFGTTLR